MKISLSISLLIIFSNLKAQNHALDSASYMVKMRNTISKEKTEENFIFSNGKLISTNHILQGYEPGVLTFEFDSIDADTSVNITFEVELINKKKLFISQVRLIQKILNILKVQEESI